MAFNKNTMETNTKDLFTTETKLGWCMSANKEIKGLIT